MHIFISGICTGIGKTLIASWICMHSGYSYFKPIQTGARSGTDTRTVARLAGVEIYPEVYCYSEPLSPHLAAEVNRDCIDLKRIRLPFAKNLIIEGAGGSLVPLNDKHLMVDLIAYLSVPVILVVGNYLGMINHALLSLESLRSRNIEVLGIIVNHHQYNYPVEGNVAAIVHHGKTRVLGQLPYLQKARDIANFALPPSLQDLLGTQYAKRSISCKS